MRNFLNKWTIGSAAVIAILCCGGVMLLPKDGAPNGSGRPVPIVPATASPGPSVIEGPWALAQSSPARSTKAPTVSQRNAINMAESYLDYTAFSRIGLIKQLKYEGFSTADATYGVDHIQVDWTAQADRMAAQYMEHSSFSRSSLIGQLKYEGFTSAQAAHGATSVGL